MPNPLSAMHATASESADHSASCRWRLRVSGVGRLIPLLAGMFAAAELGAQNVPAADRSPHSNITLVSELRSVRSGERFTVALRVTLDSGWHTYWKNGGDAGLPLNVVWRVPNGATVGTLQFPTPSLMPEGPLMAFGYTNEVIYLAEVTLPKDIRPGQTIHLNASADWLACADVCLPAAGDISLPLQVTAGPAERDLRWAPVIAEARLRMPRAGGSGFRRGWATGGGYVLALTIPAELSMSFRSPYFFVDTVAVLDHAQPQRVARAGDTIFMELPRSVFANANVSILSGVLVSDAAQPTSTSIELATRIVSANEVGALTPRAASLLRAANARRTGGVNNVQTATGAVTNPAGSELGLATAVLFAFLGGLILNLMPCVFPVLAVKVLGFVQHGGGEAGVGRRHGLVFAAGVLATFWLLAGVLLALRAGGEALGWGFQLQSPPVVAMLALVMFGLALNLSGVFEIGLSLTRLGSAGGGRRYTDSFFTGALAVVVAAPCTAPFMGAAIGFAVVQTPVASLLVFTALAIGLSLPYVVLSAAPSLLRFLPKPGAWLETFKQALAFPLYATVVWLLWVFGQQRNMNQLAVVMLGLTLFALGAWLWGRAMFGQGLWARVFGASAMLGAVAVAAVGGSTANAKDTSAVADVAWEAYSPARVAELRQAGRPVFIDFTAAWCLSCQVNERLALQSDAVKRAFTKANVALLRADWTLRDSVITRALATYGRSGVPLYVLYRASSSEPPELLPAVLTSGTVVEAVQRASLVSATALRER